MLKFLLQLFIFIIILVLVIGYFVSRDSEPREIIIGKIINQESDLENLETNKIRLIANYGFEKILEQQDLEIILDLSNFNLDQIQEIVKKYKNYSQIKYWQVAQEEQMHLIKAFSKKPIIIAESNELSLWFEKSRIADVFGLEITQYSQNKILAFLNFKMPSWTYKLRAKIIRKPIIITRADSELIDFAKQLNIADEIYIK